MIGCNSFLSKLTFSLITLFWAKGSSISYLLNYSGDTFSFDSILLFSFQLPNCKSSFLGTAPAPDAVGNPSAAAAPGSERSPVAWQHSYM